MDLIRNKYYIIRKGDFATNGNTKILYCIFSILLCIEEYYNNNSIDCFSIMIGSTIIWTIIEFLLHASRTRMIKPMYVNFFGKKKFLPNYAGVFLQGFQEGGFITTFGLYFGDRFFNLKYLILFHVLITIIIFDINLKNNWVESSRRQVNTLGSLTFICGITCYNIYCLYNNYNDFNRQFMMFFSMIYLSSIWTFFTWLNGFRTIEIYIKNKNSIIDNQKYKKKSINNIDAFLILGYDVIFEIGIVYMLFYNLFI